MDGVRNMSTTVQHLSINHDSKQAFINSQNIALPKHITCTYPTLGNPTIPIFREVPNRPINGGCFGASVFLGGICESYKLVTP